MPPTAVTHRRNTGSFGFGLKALCGAAGSNVRMTTAAKYVGCPVCKRMLAELRAAAKERNVP